MRLFKQRLEKTLTAETLRKLLLLEKEKRGIDHSKLVFVGMSNIAHYWWCAMQSVLESRERELQFFGAYLMDRLLYSYQLGYIKILPTKTEAWLDIGSRITFDEIETLLKKKQKKAGNPLKRLKEENKIDAQVLSLDTIDDAGNMIRLLNPMLSSEQREHFAAEARANSKQAVNWDDASLPPKLRGEIQQMSKAEQYPTIRWNFVWHDYVVVGVPDGITDSFVYEFKSTASQFLGNYYIKPVALAQADLYGYFFRSEVKRVQISVMEDGSTRTWDEVVNEERALETLSEFEKINKGGLAKPPKAWKCRSCEFRSSCPIYASGNLT
jgi:hypothetical protein